QVPVQDDLVFAVDFFFRGASDDGLADLRQRASAFLEPKQPVSHGVLEWLARHLDARFDVRFDACCDARARVARVVLLADGACRGSRTSSSASRSRSARNSRCTLFNSERVGRSKYLSPRSRTFCCCARSSMLALPSAACKRQ